MQKHTNSVDVIEADLPKALDRNEFVLHYQPKIDLKTGRIIGVEALIRWNHPDLGRIPPDCFIPLAEKTGEINRIGKWVLYNACRQNKEWQDNGFSPIVISVNLSPRQFSDHTLVDTVSEILKQTRLAPNYLELEITEGMTADIPYAISLLKRMKKLGVLLSMDDFGTGYSSLNSLKEFPLDTLKIDRSFLADLTTNNKGQVIVSAIISLAHQLKMYVVAEGIETHDQLLFLKQHRCNVGQGFLFYKPMPPRELEEEFR